jgi:hypothetical protein
VTISDGFYFGLGLLASIAFVAAALLAAALVVGAAHWIWRA